MLQSARRTRSTIIRGAGALTGPEIGGLFQRTHESHGVRFKLGRGAARFEGADAVQAVVLDSGERVEADRQVLTLAAVGC